MPTPTSRGPRCRGGCSGTGRRRSWAAFTAATGPGRRAAPGGPAALMAALGADADPDLPWAAVPRRLQPYWRALFMADLLPVNLRRFDIDLKSAAWRILQARGLA